MISRVALPVLILLTLAILRPANAGIVVNQYVDYGTYRADRQSEQDSNNVERFYIPVAPINTNQSFDVTAMYEATLDYGDQDGEFNFPNSLSTPFQLSGARYRQNSDGRTIDLKITNISLGSFRIESLSVTPNPNDLYDYFNLEQDSGIRLVESKSFSDHEDYLNDIGVTPGPNDSPGFFSNISFQLMVVDGQDLTGFTPDQLELFIDWTLDSGGNNQDAAQFIISSADNPNVVPEPASLAWAGCMGLIAGAGFLRRRRGRSK